MLKWEALERPNFFKLQTLFLDPDDRLTENMENQAMVDELFKRVMEEEDKNES